MPCFVEIGQPVLEKIFERFFTIYGHDGSWSCDLDYIHMHSFSIPIDASYKIWL